VPWSSNGSDCARAARGGAAPADPRAGAPCEVSACRAPYVILAVPLLIESGNWHERCQRVLVVDCPVALQRARVMARSGLPAEEVDRIIAAQADPRDAACCGR
jgi:dephospho-CoA kinase